MNTILSNMKKLFSATNVAGYILGVLGLSVFAVTQFLSAFIPLLFAPTVCGVLLLVLSQTQTSKTPLDASSIQPSATPQNSI